MPSSNNVHFGKHLTLVILWLGFVFSAFAYFIGERLVEFDPQGTLLEFDARRLTTNNLLALNDKKTIVHVSAADCKCNQYTEEHQIQIDKLANNADFSIKRIKVSDSKLVPSVPAIMVFDELGELLYLGPYATGLACSSNNSFVETVLKNFTAGYKSNLVVSEAQGCYCNLPTV